MGGFGVLGFTVGFRGFDTFFGACFWEKNHCQIEVYTFVSLVAYFGRPDPYRNHCEVHVYTSF